MFGGQSVVGGDNVIVTRTVINTSFVLKRQSRQSVLLCQLIGVQARARRLL